MDHKFFCYMMSSFKAVTFFCIFQSFVIPDSCLIWVDRLYIGFARLIWGWRQLGFTSSFFFLNVLFLFIWLLVAAHGIFSCGIWHIPWPGIKPSSLHWKHRVLATGPPRKSLHPVFVFFFFNKTTRHFYHLEVNTINIWLYILWYFF